MSEEKLSVGQHEEEQTPVDPLTVSRRWLLLTVGAFFNALKVVPGVSLQLCKPEVYQDRLA